MLRLKSELQILGCLSALGCLTALGSLLALPAAAFDSEWAGQVTGDAGNLSIENLDSLQLAHASMRAQWFGYGDSWDIEAQYQLDTLWASDPVMAAYMVPSGSKRFRLTDLDAELDTGSDDFRLWQNLDRLNVRFALPAADVTLGRQAISFGLARLFPVSDILTPELATVDTGGFRAGVDAVRAELPLGDLSQADFGYVAGESLDPALGAAFARFRTSQSGIDWELTGIALDDSYLLSAGGQGAVGEYGIWGEWAWLDSENSPGARYSLGLDFTVLDDLYSQLEYHHNSAGDFGGLIPPALSGQDYVALMGSKPLTALLSATVLSQWALNEDALALSASLGYSLSDESVMTLSGGMTESPVQTQSQVQLSMQRYF